MSKAVDLESLATEYAAKLKEAERTVARYQRLLESVRLLQQDQLGETEVPEADHGPRTVGQAVALVLPRRAARVAELSAVIQKEFPELAASVQDPRRAVAAAVHYGVRHEKYERVRKGVYRVRKE